MLIYALCCGWSRVAFTRFLSWNPPECQDWGAGRGGQANLGNARIFTASVTATPPLLGSHCLSSNHQTSKCNQFLILKRILRNCEYYRFWWCAKGKCVEANNQAIGGLASNRPSLAVRVAISGNQLVQKLALKQTKSPISTFRSFFTQPGSTITISDLDISGWLVVDSIAVPLFLNPNYREISKPV